MTVREKPLYALCVDDDPDLLEYYRSVVSEFGFEVLLATNGAEAIELIKKHAPRLAIVLSDFMMPQKNGFELREAMLEEFQTIPFVMMSGNIDREAAMQGVHLKISAFLEKPFAEAELKSTLQREAKNRVSSIKDDDEMLAGFISEAVALTEEMEEHILLLEENPGDLESINRIFACAHTIKGTSGFFQPDEVHRFTHKYEDFLSTFKKNPELLNSGTLGCLLEGLDGIKHLIGHLSEGTLTDRWESLISVFARKANEGEVLVTNDAKTAPNGNSVYHAKKTDELRVGVDVLNHFMEKSGEITVLRNMMNKVIRVIELEHNTNRNVIALTEHLSEMHKVISGMQDQIGDLKKVSLQQVFKPMSRAIRDLCSTLKKKIALKVVGEEIRIDHSLSEVLNKCLIHLIRNSADHGIEMPDERVALGKPADGTISIQVKETSEEITISISDDGRGINAERVKAKCLEKKLITPEVAASLSDNAARMLIFEPGFSTSEEVTSVSGRGVGTDMVKKTIQDCGGKLELHSQPGKGTVFILHLPIPKSVLIIQSLMVRIKDEFFAIPQNNIIRVIELNPEDSQFKKIDNQWVYDPGEQLLPVVNLDTILGMSSVQDFSETSSGILIWLEGAHSPYCLRVDEVMNIEDIVVKEVGTWFSCIDIYSGATFMADGLVGLIIDTEGVAKRAGFNKRSDELSGLALVPETGIARSLFLFELGENLSYAIPQEELYRLEYIDRDKLQSAGGKTLVVFRGGAMPIYDLSSVIKGASIRPAQFTSEKLATMVIEHDQRYYGFVVPEFSDFELNVIQEGQTLTPFQETLIIRNKTVTLIKLREWIDQGLLAA